MCVSVVEGRWEVDGSVIGVIVYLLLRVITPDPFSLFYDQLFNLGWITLGKIDKGKYNNNKTRKQQQQGNRQSKREREGKKEEEEQEQTEQEGRSDLILYMSKSHIFFITSLVYLWC